MPENVLAALQELHSSGVGSGRENENENIASALKLAYRHGPSICYRMTACHKNVLWHVYLLDLLYLFEKQLFLLSWRSQRRALPCTRLTLLTTG